MPASSWSSNPQIRSCNPLLFIPRFVHTLLEGFFRMPASTVSARVQLAASTQYHPIDIGNGERFEVDAEGGCAVAEAAGRACYGSWHRPNPTTASNAGYLNHIMESTHGSVLEHGSVSFFITGVSRTLTHELIRSRHFSYSQQSQRYVDEAGATMIQPPLLVELLDAAGSGGETGFDALVEFEDAANVATVAYERLTDIFLEGLDKLAPNLSKTDRRKSARQAARAILPNATETRIMVTGNYRAWRHFLTIRGTEHADVEIRQVAVLILRELQKLAPNAFADFTVDADGIIHSQYGSI